MNWFGLRRVVIVAGISGAFAVGGACKSRHTIGGPGGAGLRDAGSGLSEADKALVEFEVVDCSVELCGDGESDSGAGGVSFANPTVQDMLVASSKAGVAREDNPYGELDFGQAGDDRVRAHRL